MIILGLMVIHTPLRFLLRWGLDGPKQTSGHFQLAIDAGLFRWRPSPIHHRKVWRVLWGVYQAPWARTSPSNPPRPSPPQGSIWHQFNIDSTSISWFFDAKSTPEEERARRIRGCRPGGPVPNKPLPSHVNRRCMSYKEEVYVIQIGGVCRFSQGIPTRKKRTFAKTYSNYKSQVSFHTFLDVSRTQVAGTPLNWDFPSVVKLLASLRETSDSLA